MATNEPNLELIDGRVRAEIDLRTYRLAAIKKAAYRLAARMTVVLGRSENDLLSVTFTFAPGASRSSADEAVRAFFQELLDQELREHVAEETSAMRMLILAQAFSKTDLIRRE